MTEQEILDRLARSDVSAERLLEECRGPDRKLWQGNATLYRAFTEKLLAQGYPARALDLAREGRAFLHGDDGLQFLLALAARRGGNPRYAQLLLDPLLPRALDPQSPLPTKLRVDIVALQGGILKVQSRTAPGLLARSAEWYGRAGLLPGAAELPDAATYQLVNAATMWRLAGQEARSKELAAEVIRRMAATDERAGDPLWRPATLGEALLLLGEHDSSADHYVLAVAVARASNRSGDLAAIRANIERLRAAGLTANPAAIDEHLGSVVVFSGHMVDSPDRLKEGHPPRFPNREGPVGAAGRAIAAKLADVNAKVGYCSLACGGDLLFAEAMLARGAELHVVLPFAQHDFLRTSVNFGQDGEIWRDWRTRFDEVLNAVPVDRVRYTTKEEYLDSNDLFGLSGRVQQGLAVLRARERGTVPQAVLLLDKSIPGRPGGARSFADGWTASGYAVHEIDLRATLAGIDLAGPDPAEIPAAPTSRGRLARPVKSILFADVAGFSRIPEWLLDEFFEAFGAYLHDLFASRFGRAATYANTWGDGIYGVFETVSDAAAFAMELIDPTVGVQPKWKRFLLGDTVPFRVGLHTGPVFELPDLFQGRPGYGGQHVNRAARIEPATVPGCAYASEPFAALLTMEGADRFHIEGVGLHSLAKEYDRCPLYQIAR